MALGSSIFAILWSIVLPISVFLNICVRQIRLFDTFIFKLLSKKNLRLGQLFNLLKLAIFAIIFFLFLVESLRFYYEIFISNSQAFFLSLILVIPIQLLFIYNVIVYVYNIYTRGYVFIDEIFKLIVLLLLTCILNMFSNELNFLPGNSFFPNQKGPPIRNHKSDNKRRSDT